MSHAVHTPSPGSVFLEAQVNSLLCRMVLVLTRPHAGGPQGLWVVSVFQVPVLCCV